jgi:hypothetical protein
MGVISNLLLSAYSYSDDSEEVKDSALDDLSQKYTVRDPARGVGNETTDYSLEDGAKYFEFMHRYTSTSSKSQANKRTLSAKRKNSYSAVDVGTHTSSYGEKSYWVNEDGAVEFVRD